MMNVVGVISRTISLFGGSIKRILGNGILQSSLSESNFARQCMEERRTDLFYSVAVHQLLTQGHARKPQGYTSPAIRLYLYTPATNAKSAIHSCSIRSCFAP